MSEEPAESGDGSGKSIEATIKAELDEAETRAKHGDVDGAEACVYRAKNLAYLYCEGGYCSDVVERSMGIMETAYSNGESMSDIETRQMDDSVRIAKVKAAIARGHYDAASVLLGGVEGEEARGLRTQIRNLGYKIFKEEPLGDIESEIIAEWDAVKYNIPPVWSYLVW